jgi:photosystem II stability/assembly factor-like uncharacterized protein
MSAVRVTTAQLVRGVRRFALRARPHPSSHVPHPFFFCLLLTAYCLTASAAWSRQDSGTLVPLRAVFFLDEQRGWAVGGKGALLATGDGGAHWRTLKRPTDDALRDVFFVDDATGWLVCERSMFALQTAGAQPRAYLLKTADGGVSWQRVEVIGRDTDTVLVRVVFADAAHGWTFGEEGALYATTDGGRTWGRQHVPTRHLLLGGTFLDPLQGWLVGAGATILRTTDGGAEWRALSAPVETGARLNAITFADARHGWAVGTRGLVLATVDGGRSWTPQTANTESDLFDVKFLDAREGWAAGADGVLLHTADGGTRWQTENSPAHHPLERLCFVSRARGWAVGFGGTIITYTPGQSAPPVIKAADQRP